MTVLVVLGLIAGGIFGAKQFISANYYVAAAAENDNALTIQKGVDFSVFGKPLHATYQNACINRDGGLRLTASACSGDYAPFHIEDLPDSERGVIPNLESGPYETVQSQLTRLSDKALPACRPTPAPSAGDNPGDNPGEANGANAAADNPDDNPGETDSPETDSPETGSPDPSAAPTSNPTPTERSDNPQEGYLSSPGIDCREVQ